VPLVTNHEQRASTRPSEVLAIQLSRNRSPLFIEEDDRKDTELESF
jgi:hypothetical protein